MLLGSQLTGCVLQWHFISLLRLVTGKEMRKGVKTTLILRIYFINKWN